MFGICFSSSSIARRAFYVIYGSKIPLLKSSVFFFDSLRKQINRSPFAENPAGPVTSGFVEMWSRVGQVLQAYCRMT